MARTRHSSATPSGRGRRQRRCDASQESGTKQPNVRIERPDASDQNLTRRLPWRSAALVYTDGFFCAHRSLHGPPQPGEVYTSGSCRERFELAQRIVGSSSETSGGRASSAASRCAAPSRASSRAVNGRPASVMPLRVVRSRPQHLGALLRSRTFERATLTHVLPRPAHAGHKRAQAFRRSGDDPKPKPAPARRSRLIDTPGPPRGGDCSVRRRRVWCAAVGRRGQWAAQSARREVARRPRAGDALVYRRRGR
jgi:hypothetical protein